MMILGTFAELPKAPISFIMFVSLAVPLSNRAHSIPRLTSGQIFMKFHILGFS